MPLSHKKQNQRDNVPIISGKASPEKGTGGTAAWVYNPPLDSQTGSISKLSEIVKEKDTWGFR